MDKKLTDSEIVKALECCTEQHSCTECPLFKTKSKCTDFFLDLVNRLQAENEKLKIWVSQNEGVLPKYEDFIKAEAYKEFADKLKRKEQYTYNYQMNIGTYCVTTEDIDNLLKELVGEDK